MIIKDISLDDFLNRVMSFIALFIFVSNFAYSQLSNIDKKCLWVVRESMISKSEIDSALLYAFKVGFDIVFLQVRGRGDAFFNSKIVCFSISQIIF